MRRKPDRIATKGLSVPAETILLQDWETPFEMPPFAAIRDEDFMPAFQEAMRLHLAEVEAIASNARDANLREHDRGAGKSGPRPSESQLGFLQSCVLGHE